MDPGRKRGPRHTDPTNGVEGLRVTLPLPTCPGPCLPWATVSQWTNVGMSEPGARPTHGSQGTGLETTQRFEDQYGVRRALFVVTYLVRSPGVEPDPSNEVEGFRGDLRGVQGSESDELPSLSPWVTPSGSPRPRLQFAQGTNTRPGTVCGTYSEKGSFL